MSSPKRERVAEDRVSPRPEPKTGLRAWLAENSGLAAPIGIVAFLVAVLLWGLFGPR